MSLTQGEIEAALKRLAERREKGARILFRTRTPFFESFLERRQIEDFIRASVGTLSGLVPGWKISVERFLVHQGEPAVIVRAERAA